MPAETTLQRPSFWLGYPVIAVGLGIALWKYAMLLAGPVGNDPSDPAIRETAFLVVWLWPWGAALPFAVRNWQPEQPGFPAGRTRWAYTIAWGLCLLHIAIAFHVGHAWSHRAAFDHTERVSGFGPGIFVNYLFVLVWTGDVFWAWINLDSYLGRPAWVNWLVLGFMGFVVFNAAVVFGGGMQRWASLLFLVGPLLVTWWCRRWNPDNRIRPN
jgi:hypothetical protein